MVMLDGLLGGMLAMPANLGAVYNQMYGPMFSYGQSQGNNLAQLGGQSMGLYGNLAGQQAQMYQTELPLQMEMARWNAVAPALSGLLGQFGMGGLGNVSMNFNRPDVMSGFNSVVNNAYTQARAYDPFMEQTMGRAEKMAPPAPWNTPMGSNRGGGDGRFGGREGGGQSAQGRVVNNPSPPGGPVDIDSGFYGYQPYTLATPKTGGAPRR